jgi:hypothetical protein
VVKGIVANRAPLSTGCFDERILERAIKFLAYKREIHRARDFDLLPKSGGLPMGEMNIEIDIRELIGDLVNLIMTYYDSCHIST